MTIGIAILLLWITRVIIQSIRKVEEKAQTSGITTAIPALAYMVVTVWMIIRFWNTPW